LITGWVFCYAGAAIAYKSKLQTVIATSSTEAKFVAAYMQPRQPGIYIPF